MTWIVVIVLAAVLLAAFILAQTVRHSWGNEQVRQQRFRESQPINAQRAAMGLPPYEQAVNSLFPDDAEKGRWPELCAQPPCEPADEWSCIRHRPCWGCGARHGINEPCFQSRGRHARRQSEGQTVILASVTDLADRRPGRA